MDERTFRQFRKGHSALVAQLPNCLLENDLFAFVLRFHPSDSRPSVDEQSGETRSRGYLFKVNELGSQSPFSSSF
jgi:hypothetical protein